MTQATKSRETSKRRWTATVTFLLTHNWTPKVAVTVEHNSIDGAARMAVREAKKKAVKTRTQIRSVYLTLNRAILPAGATQEVN